MLWLAHLVWRLECSVERGVGGLDKAQATAIFYVTRQEARSFTKRE